MQLKAFSNKKSLTVNKLLSGTNIIIRGATLLHGMTHALAGYLHIPGNLRMPYVMVFPPCPPKSIHKSLNCPDSTAPDSLKSKYQMLLLFVIGLYVIF